MTSINLGTPAITAISRLRGSADMEAVIDGLGDLVSKATNLALDVPPESRVDSTAYVRALRDVFVAVKSAYTGVGQVLIKFPELVERAPTAMDPEPEPDTATALPASATGKPGPLKTTILGKGQ